MVFNGCCCISHIEQSSVRILLVIQYRTLLKIKACHAISVTDSVLSMIYLICWEVPAQLDCGANCTVNAHIPWHSGLPVVFQRRWDLPAISSLFPSTYSWKAQMLSWATWLSKANGMCSSVLWSLSPSNSTGLVVVYTHVMFTPQKSLNSTSSECISVVYTCHCITTHS